MIVKYTMTIDGSNVFDLLELVHIQMKCIFMYNFANCELNIIYYK